MRPTRDQWALELARVTAQRATCLRRAVGCVLLSARGHVLATGYNGVAAGAAHCNEVTSTEAASGAQGLANLVYGNRGRAAPKLQTPLYAHACPGARAPSGQNLDGCQAIHAEQNALLQCSDVHAIDTCYVTASPCVTCVKLLLNTSCNRIVFAEEYPHGEARKWWEAAGRKWEKLG